MDDMRMEILEEVYQSFGTFEQVLLNHTILMTELKDLEP